MSKGEDIGVTVVTGTMSTPRRAGSSRLSRKTSDSTGPKVVVENRLPPGVTHSRQAQAKTFGLVVRDLVARFTVQLPESGITSNLTATK